MSYSFEGRVRFSETGEEERLTLPALLDYYQDCVSFQAEEIHQTRAACAARNRGWVLSSWQVEIRRYPTVGEKIRITTIPYEFRSFMGFRNFVLETQEGELLSRANSCWANINLKTGRPERLTEEDKAGYVLGPRLPMDYTSRKIELPQGGVRGEPFTVEKHHLDHNHHVNNCQYVRMATNDLPEGGTVRSLRAEYQRQGRLGDVFYPVIFQIEGGRIISLQDAEGRPYAVIELLV